MLAVGEMDAPRPSPGEVLVRVQASGVKKRSDWVGLGLGYPRVIPHSDGAGVIEDVGEDVSSSRAGQRVWVWGAQSGRPFGTAAEYTVAMLALEERARRIEAELPNVPIVNVVAGFPYADVPEAGVSFSAVTDGDLELARSALRELNVVASSLREVGTPTLSTLEKAMARLDGHDEWPVLLVEPSDNVGAGAPGDGTQVLRALVEHGVPKAGVVVNDPESVATLEDADPGERHALMIGGKSGEIWAEPLPLEVEVVSRSDGRFVAEIREDTLAGPPGGEILMGPCAVVRHGGAAVLLTSRRTPPFDLAQWRSQGVDPEDLFVIAVKAATEHKQAYGPIARGPATFWTSRGHAPRTSSACPSRT